MVIWTLFWEVNTCDRRDRDRKRDDRGLEYKDTSGFWRPFYSTRVIIDNVETGGDKLTKYVSAETGSTGVQNEGVRI